MCQSRVLVPGICCGAGWLPAAGWPPRRCRCGRSRRTTAPACRAAAGPGPGVQLHRLRRRGIQNQEAFKIRPLSLSATGMPV